jgi:multicomponent Na+:H+ antiporter subunit A
VLLLGAVGYGVAVLFILQGAPDLALTQTLIETLSLVLFVLVLKLLPDRFRVSASRLRVNARVAVAVLVGLFAAGSLIVASGVRTEPSVSEEISEVALPEGGGRNVVNVILVDIRGFDTMGEITVLAVAALGILTLVRTRREGESLHEDDQPGGAPPDPPSPEPALTGEPR